MEEEDKWNLMFKLVVVKWDLIFYLGFRMLSGNSRGGMHGNECMKTIGFSLTCETFPSRHMGFGAVFITVQG